MNDKEQLVRAAQRIAELEAQNDDLLRENEELKAGLERIESGLQDLGNKIDRSLELVA